MDKHTPFLPLVVNLEIVYFYHSVDVIAIAAGPQHVVAVGSDSEVFAWGRGDGGRLGLGNDED